MTRPQLSICLPVYDDCEGLLFTATSLALHHDLSDCEVLVVDNHPDSEDGKNNKNLIDGWLSQYPKAPIRYLAVPRPVGPGATKDRAVREAAGEAVLCLDSHILLAPGSIQRLKQFYAENPDTKDLFTGPLLSNGLSVIATHFSDVWRGEMWGIWAQAWSCPCGWTFDCREVPIAGGQTPPPPVTAYYDLAGQTQVQACPKCQKSLPICPWHVHDSVLEQEGCRKLGHDLEEQPFEIPAMGMGLFSCRKEAWLGFAADVQGFGAEEFCIHGRYKKHGHTTYNLPFLRWWHRFYRKHVPYPLNRYEKVRNYVLEFRDLNWPLDPIHDHFVATSLLPKHEWEHLLKDPVAHVSAPGQKTGCGGCGANKQAAQSQQAGLSQPPAGANIDQIFTWATQTAKRDLDQHLPKLLEMAAGQEHITEISKRRESTVAFLAARPKTFISYQRERDPLNEVLHKVVEKPLETYTQHLGDHDGVPDMAETDGLFLDDQHTFDRLYLQLTRLAPKVRKWIAMHDTQSYGEMSDGGTRPGLLGAIRKFLKESPEWSVVYHSPAQYGLTVISRDPADKPKLPSIPRMALNLAKAMAEHAKNGFKTAIEETFNARIDVCTTCPQRNDTRCSVCGCFIEAKASLDVSECPLGFWS